MGFISAYFKKRDLGIQNVNLVEELLDRVIAFLKLSHQQKLSASKGYVPIETTTRSFVQCRQIQVRVYCLFLGYLIHRGESHQIVNCLRVLLQLLEFLFIQYSVVIPHYGKHYEIIILFLKPN